MNLKNNIKQKVAQRIRDTSVALVAVLLTSGILLWKYVDASNGTLWAKATPSEESFCGVPDGVDVNGAMFKIHCASCHKPNRTIVGPPLIPVLEKVDSANFHAFIQNEEEALASGYRRVYPDTLYTKYIFNHNFSYAPDSSLAEIITYLSNYPNSNP